MYLMNVLESIMERMGQEEPPRKKLKTELINSQFIPNQTLLLEH